MITEYLEYIYANKRYSECTIRRYSAVLHTFAQSMQGYRWSTIKQSDIERYLAAYVCAPSTQANMISVLRSFFGYLVTHRGLAENPCRYVSMPKVPELTPHPITMEQVTKAVASCRTDEMKLAILLMAKCGLRVSEVLSLSSYDILGDKALVMGKGRKERYVFLPSDVCSLIAALGRTGRIFGGWEDRQFRKAIWLVFRSQGEGVSPHQLRHTFATYAINRGMPINQLAMLLGHSDIRTTQRYLHAGADVIRSSYNQLYN